MATEIVMPQMGESIAEGTITKWIKKIGERVERDEPLFEISTDKVDAEIPSPASGVLLQILHNEGETVEVNKAVAIVGEESEAGAAASASNGSANGAATNGNAATAQAASAQTSAAASTTQEGEISEAAGRSYDYGSRPGAAEQAQEPVSAPAPQQNQSAQNQSSEPNAAPAASSAGGSDAATEIVMPQMGESIAEGTITRWIKKVGDRVERDEPLFEISTDKVDAEIPSPAAGILLQILHNEGETVEVNKAVALIGAEGAAGSTTQVTNAASAQTVQPSSLQTNALEAEQESAEAMDAQIPGVAAVAQTQTTQSGVAPTAQQSAITASAGHPEQVETEGRSYDYSRPEAVQEASRATNGLAANGGGAAATASVEELRRTKSSPLVRKIAEEHNIDISRISGTGASGRVTKDDIMNFIASGAALTPQQAAATAKTGAALPAAAAPSVQTQPQPQQFTARAPQQPQIQPQTVAVPQPQTQVTQFPAQTVGDRVEPMSVMRKKIAQHMTMSKQTSAHVSSVYEIDMTNVVKFRDRNKNEFQQRYGTKLTFMPFIFQAVTSGLRKFPIVNSQVSGENIVYKGDVNLGMAVALDWGLIVPVIKRADTLSLAGLALAANDLADRARSKKLVPDEVAGGTFTITNPGVFGGLFGTPIINQPQVAILCVGTIEKRPKVITSPDGDDYIAIRQMAYFALTYDHRVVDGADAEKFLSFVKETLEAGQFSL